MQSDHASAARECRQAERQEVIVGYSNWSAGTSGQAKEVRAGY